MIRFKNISEKIANPYPIIVFKDFLDNQEIKYMSEFLITILDAIDQALLLMLQ